MEHADVRYLESKRSVDARARSPRVRDRLLDELPPAPTIVDVGAGTGAMLPTLLRWGVIAGTYRGIERSTALVEHAREAAPAALEGRYAVERRDDGFDVEDVAVRFETGDALELSADAADLVVGQALLDLVPIREAIDAIVRTLRPGGLAYLPITFDGGTVFLPSRSDDEAVVGRYHDAIDATPGRDSRAGRRLIEHLQERRGQLLAVAASNWIVRPRGGGYPAEEAHFLNCILGFVEDTLTGSPIDATAWLAARRGQLEAGELTYLAHNYDLLYRTPEG